MCLALGVEKVGPMIDTAEKSRTREFYVLDGSVSIIIYVRAN
jgi:hypothetical protein